MMNIQITHALKDHKHNCLHALFILYYLKYHQYLQRPWSPQSLQNHRQSYLLSALHSLILLECW